MACGYCNGKNRHRNIHMPLSIYITDIRRADRFALACMTPNASLQSGNTYGAYFPSKEKDSS
ncbi:hypothetical protein VIAG107301_17070 [Vibrio agarivorans]